VRPKGLGEFKWTVEYFIMRISELRGNIKWAEGGVSVFYQSSSTSSIFPVEVSSCRVREDWISCVT
jgi:hypothetical protein